MALLRLGVLPKGAMDAAAAFHASIVPRAREALAGAEESLVLVFAPESSDHRGWRLAAVQQLAREHAPQRVNALESGNEDAIAAACAYLDRAPGLTGQLLRLADTGAMGLSSVPP